MLSKFHSCVSYTCIYITCAHVATVILLINVSIKINNVSEATIREAVVSAVTACESLNHSYSNILDSPKEHHLNYRWEQGSFINKCSSVYSWVFNVKLKYTNILFIGKCFETSSLTTYNYQNQPNLNYKQIIKNLKFLFCFISIILFFC